ncbi:hypothetical protein A5482_014785 (plasmid) [Cyanobacterium sp. IPPAS B-1200]|uniref:hypothetical protein n=1 Tax=Cyanobacterium sp. IPPAS B-1200 TaxID=1562720 RepID=UPI00085262F4|nr:hypothetical protein [Cyanobacterium sp. IPPAS B-1200]OEJ78135.1 hypothetical protein A5482_13940 [Cyanobacterium sp. IPPAS B-1200]
MKLIVSKVTIIVGSLLLSGTYLSVEYLLRTEVQDITQKIERAIALNNWKENCIIAGRGKHRVRATKCNL